MPALIIIGFLIVYSFANIIVHDKFTSLKPLRNFLKNTIFNDPKATSTLLGTIATSIITVSSLSFTLLLIVVQQIASTMSTEVFDQFLRSRHNQTYFGFFIGLSLYTLVILATVSENDADGKTVGNVLCKTITIDEKTDIGSDSFGGIVETEAIGWTPISTAE